MITFFSYSQYVSYNPPGSKEDKVGIYYCPAMAKGFQLIETVIRIEPMRYD